MRSELDDLPEKYRALIREDLVLSGRIAADELWERARPRWESKVAYTWSMEALVFFRPEDEYPWDLSVRVGTVGVLGYLGELAVEGAGATTDDRDAFEFQLHRRRHLITADRSTAETADAMLDAFLMQLTGT